MKAYLHKIQYYETDAMNVVHHSNYIRWFEEARVDYMEQMGKGYDQIEKEGFICPVVSIECNYISPSKFGDSVYISTCLENNNGIRFGFSYKVVNSKTGVILCEGLSKHCFIKNYKIISLKKENKEVFELFNSFTGIKTEIPQS